MKNYTEEEKEMINGALRSYTEDYWFGGGDYLRVPSADCMEHFQELNGLTSKPKLEVGKFYKLTGDYCNLRKGMVFPFLSMQDPSNRWATVKHSIYLDYPATETGRSYMSPPIKYLVEATNEEVKTALTKEAKKRGFVEGVTIEKDMISKPYDGLTLDSYDIVNPLWRCDGSGTFYLGNKCIMNNGVWATIVKTTTKMSVAQLEAAHGYTNLEITK
tara:strand:+ start:779 stop:1426 length:648 start_codon:yes stop_codon:yes gene_type:complete